MGSSVRFNQQALAEVVQQAAQRAAGAHQRVLDRLQLECFGQSVEQVRLQLAAAWAAVNGGQITDPELSAWAERLSAGQRIELIVQSSPS